MDLKIQKIRIDGLSFHVRSAGAGPLVVLLHGFPDSGEVWRMQVPALVAAGHHVLVPDLRGFGETEAPPEVGRYRLERLVADLFDIVDVAAPEVGQFDVIGHDWGAVVGWLGSIAEPERIRRFAALSVGHPEAYRRAGLEQKLKGWYLLLFATPILAEAALAAGNFRMLRRQAPTAEDGARWSRDLARPGRLTAGLNWYRANLRDALGARVPSSAVPTLGVYSMGDVALAEDQMRDSAQYVAADWRYERFDSVGHWLQIEAADRLNQLLVDWLATSRAIASAAP